MDTEKIKQMGRDYFTANPGKRCLPTCDSFFTSAWKERRAKEPFEKDASYIYNSWHQFWKLGWKEAQYAASKKGRAIELLGRLIEYKDSDLPWHNARAFLKEIGWKPTL